MSITLLLADDEIKRLVQLDLAERARLCDPVAIARGYAALKRIKAAMELKRMKQLALPLEVEAA